MVVMSILEQYIVDLGRFRLKLTFSDHNYHDIGQQTSTKGYIYGQSQRIAGGTLRHKIRDLLAVITALKYTICWHKKLNQMFTVDCCHIARK
jgi:hypothetical protein